MSQFSLSLATKRGELPPIIQKVRYHFFKIFKNKQALTAYMTASSVTISLVIDSLISPFPHGTLHYR